MSDAATAVSNPQAKVVTAENRIPMSTPNQKLAVPEIPGFHLHWHLGKNVHRALASGYTHVTSADGVDVANVAVADSKYAPGSTDLGVNISIIAGDTPDEAGDPERLYLMKLPQEWWEADQKSLIDRNEQVAAQLRGGSVGAEGETAKDKSRRYLKKGQDLFIPKK